jgi:hypothetical protein
VVNALADFGVEDIAMPVSPQRIWTTLKAANLPSNHTPQA